MEPRIQYATASDGVKIAFWDMGEGPPLVYLPGIPWSHIQLEARVPQLHGGYELLARRRMLIRYDPRGCGSSEREIPEPSLDAYLLDLEAMVSHLGLETFDLYGLVHSGPVAIAYAARHPERISHLILWCSYARAAGVYDSQEGRAFRALRDQDWRIYTEAVAHILLGWSAGELAHKYAGYLQECVTPEAARAAHAAIEAFDVTDLLPRVASPTLVLHQRGLAFPDVAIARALAAHIPGARLAILEGSPGVPFFENTDAWARAIFDFLGEGEEAAARAEAPAPGAFRTILFTDLTQSTALAQHLGDAKAQEIRRAHNAVVREALTAYAGSEIKHTGDGIMASFPSASGALECAVAIQRAVAQRGDPNLGVHIGLNAGEPIAEEQDLFGTSVDLARRICDQAEGGEILVSDVVRQLVAGKDFLFADRGEAALRGFEDPVRLVEVRWQ